MPAMTSSSGGDSAGPNGAARGRERRQTGNNRSKYSNQTMTSQIMRWVEGEKRPGTQKILAFWKKTASLMNMRNGIPSRNTRWRKDIPTKNSRRSAGSAKRIRFTTRRHLRGPAHPATPQAEERPRRFPSRRRPPPL